MSKNILLLNSKGDMAFVIINNILVFISFMLVFYPLYYICIASVSDPNLVNTGEVWLLPKGITFDGYNAIFKNSDIWVGYRNTIFYSISGMFVSLFLCFTMAYALAAKNIAGKSAVVVFLTIPMFISGGLIPYYLVMRTLNMINTIWAQIIPGAVGLWSIVVVRTYFQTSIPAELNDSAMIDGCSFTKRFLLITLPLSKPIIAVMALFAAVGQWNSFFNALIFITDRRLFTLQLVLREILILNDFQTMMDKMQNIRDMELHNERVKAGALIKYAVIIVSSLPVIAVYPFLQRYFIKGIMVGAIKG